MSTPDIEQLVGDWLRTDPTITALVAGRVVGRTPDDTTDAWARVTLIDDRQVAGSSVLHLVDALIQIDCYAGDLDRGHAKEEARDLAAAVRARLHDMPGVHGAAVVTDVSNLALRPSPDPDLTPARERYIVTANLFAH